MRCGPLQGRLDDEAMFAKYGGAGDPGGFPLRLLRFCGCVGPGGGVETSHVDR